MTTELKNKLTQVNSFIDEAFDLKRLSDFHLIIQAGNDGLLLTVFDKEKNKYIAFENYSFQQVFDFDLVADLFEIAAKESRIINQKYKTVSCSVVNHLSTLVPAALFEEDRKSMYLKFNATLHGNELVLTDELKNLEAKNVFAIPFSLKAKLDYMYNKVNYHHFSSGLIEGLLLQNKNQTTKKLIVHIQPSHFEAIVIEGKKLLFYNTFQHHSAEDFMYYLLFVCEQLHLNTETTETLFIGEIERTSQIYTLTQKYIRTLKLGERRDTADFSYQLQTLPKHFYFSLFNSSLL
ncbi:MAG: hypothetical protein JWP12_3283 [Bacteroidetes bacterium]|nr:hypothetical protein [Bacteroidota bacterium]